jgi:putative spermidine/putrescine transport system substrate-binding protein
MSKKLTLVAAVLAAFAAGAGPARAAEPTGEVVLMTYAGIFQDLYTKAVIEPFMRKHPGIKVQYAPGGTSAAMLGQLRAQKADPQIDVTILDAGVGLVANKEGVFAPLSATDAPVVSELFPQATIQEGYGPAVTFDSLVFVYDTTKVKGTPTSLAELWKPEYQGKIGLSGMPNILGIALTVVTAKMVGEDHTTSIDKAVAKLGELAPGVQTFEPQPDGYTMVLNDALVWAIGWNARAQTYRDQSKGRLGVMLPSEGSVFQINTINLVQGAKHKEAALAFIDYALSAEAQKSFTETMFYAPVNKTAKISEAALAKTSSAQMDRMIPVDWGELAKVRDAWNNRWKREIIAKSR